MGRVRGGVFLGRESRRGHGRGGEEEVGYVRYEGLMEHGMEWN